MDSGGDIHNRVVEEPIDNMRRKMRSYVSENPDGWEKTTEHAWQFKNSAWQFMNSDIREITKPLRQTVMLYLLY